MSIEPTRRSGALAGALVVLAGLAAPVAAGEAEAARVRAHCESQLNVPTGTCACLATKALAMGEDQQALLAAMADGDEAAAARLRTRLPVPQVMEVGMFYVNQTPACAGG